MSKCSSLWNKSGRPKSAEVIQDKLGCSLRLPCPTRWNSLFDSINVLLEKKAVLNEAMCALNLPIFKSHELEFLEEYVTVLAPIAIAIDRLQGEKAVFMGICFLRCFLFKIS